MIEMKESLRQMVGTVESEIQEHMLSAHGRTVD